MSVVNLSVCIVCVQTKAIASAIQFTPLIRRIKIIDIDLGDTGLTELCRVFKSNLNVTKVHLENLRITKHGVSEFGQHLAHSRSQLATLTIKSNKIGDSGVRRLCQALESCPTAKLSLENCAFSTKGFRSLFEMLSLETWVTTLRHLDISGNAAGSSGSKALAQWIFVGMFVLSCCVLCV